MPRIVPESWMDSAPMNGIVCHWTAGAYEATEHDRECYHIIINGDGRLVRGDHTIADNLKTGDGDYAPHTGRHNSGMIGVSVSCMRNATEIPWSAGSHPMTKVQWNAMMAVCADLVQHYRLPISTKTLCGHGLVYAHHGEANPTGKWDPLKLPWNPRLSLSEVDKLIRTETEALLGHPSGPEIGSLPVRVLLNGAPLSDDAYNTRGMVWLAIRPLSAALSFSILDVTARQVLIGHGGATKIIDFTKQGNVGYVKARDLRSSLKTFDTEWDPKTQTLNLVSG